MEHSKAIKKHGVIKSTVKLMKHCQSQAITMHGSVMVVNWFECILVPKLMSYHSDDQVEISSSTLTDHGVDTKFRKADPAEMSDTCVT